MASRTLFTIGLAALGGLAPAGAALGDVVPLEFGHSTDVWGRVRSYAVPGGDGFRYTDEYTQMGAWSSSASDSVSYWSIDVESSIVYHGEISPTSVGISTHATSRVGGIYYAVPSPTGESESWSRTHYRFQLTEPMYISIEGSGELQGHTFWGTGMGVWLNSLADGVLFDSYNSMNFSFNQMLPAGEYIFASYTVTSLVGIDIDPTNETCVLATDIRMTLIPAPASAVLLGLGAVVCPARRRR